MKLIESLCSGVVGAEDGTVDIYRRGTSTRASYYLDFEATSQITPTASIDLDSNGGGVFYVNEFVNCIVRDSSGVVVREFVAGDQATTTEVISQSFTGIDYTSGASAASKPVPLSTVLDRLKTSAGAIDFNILVGGVSTTLQAAFSAVGGMFFNVKSSTYGALGDGTTDDTSAIAAAVAAAVAVGGGIVYFPPGTYKTVAAIAVGADVTFLGAGPAASIFLRDHATNHTLTYAGTGRAAIRDLGFTDNQNNSGDIVRLTAATTLLIDNCAFGTTGKTRGDCIESTSATSSLTVRSCNFVCGSDAAATAITTTGDVMVIGGTTTLDAVQNRAMWLQGSNARVIGHKFVCGANTAGTEILSIAPTGEFDGNNLVTGCHFTNVASGTAAAMNFNREGFAEYGNTFGNTWSGAGLGGPVIYGAFSSVGGDATTSLHSINSRDTRKYYIASDAAVTIPSDVNGICLIKRATNANQTVTLAAPLGPGKLCFGYWNNSGGNIAVVTLTTVSGLAVFALNAGLGLVYTFEATYMNGWKWVYPISTGATFTP